MLKPRSAAARRTLVLIGVIAAAAAAGYVVTWAIFPAPIVTRPVKVPALRGEPLESAMDQLTKLGLRGRVSDTTPDPMTAIGTVSWQSPAPETVLPQGSAVKIGVSRGAPSVAMPQVADLDVALARQVIDAAGLKVSSVDTLAQDTDFGTVISTSPQSGSTLKAGDSVSLTISSGPVSIPVPDLTGLAVVAARERLNASGLRVGALLQRFEGRAGTVLAQRPAPGELVIRQSAVDLTISGTLP